MRIQKYFVLLLLCFGLMSYEAFGQRTERTNSTLSVPNKALPETIQSLGQSNPLALTINPALRHGGMTPLPTNETEQALQYGIIADTVKNIGGGVNDFFKGQIHYQGRSIAVGLKPDKGLKGIKSANSKSPPIRTTIPVGTDNKRADAAFQLNKFIDLVDTPEHVIRNDVPESVDSPARGVGGVQTFLSDCEKPGNDVISAIEAGSRPDLKAELEEIALFDSIIGNLDRHNGNWLYRKSPKPNQRHIVAIDHSLAFPMSNLPDYGSRNMQEWFIRQTKDGQLTDANLKKLDAMVAHRKEIDLVLRLDLEPEARELMWERIAQMRKTHKVFIANM